MLNLLNPHRPVSSEPSTVHLVPNAQTAARLSSRPSATAKATGQPGKKLGTESRERSAVITDYARGRGVASKGEVENSRGEMTNMVNEEIQRPESGTGHVSEHAAVEHRHVDEHAALYSRHLAAHENVYARHREERERLAERHIADHGRAAHAGAPRRVAVSLRHAGQHLAMATSHAAQLALLNVRHASERAGVDRRHATELITQERRHAREDQQ
jgi:hypothetical protein